MICARPSFSQDKIVSNSPSLGVTLSLGVLAG